MGIPTDNATHNAPTEFLILWIPSKGTLIFFKLIGFLFGRLTLRSNSEYVLNCLILLILKLNKNFAHKYKSFYF